ncbi:px domain protein [Apiospora saccharicola]
MPGLVGLPLDFYKTKCRTVMQRLGEADLSESYDKASMGTRKTLATAASALHEAVSRGMLGGVPPPNGPDAPTPAQRWDPDVTSAAELEASFDFCLRDLVYGDLLERLFHFSRQSQDFDRFSQQIGDSIEYIVIHLATFIHYILVVSPEGPYLLKLIESFSKLYPYTMAAQTLRLGNAATMINAMNKLFLSKMTVGGITNWMGITQGANDGMNLMQRMLSIIVDYDASDFRKAAEAIKKTKSRPSDKHFAAIDEHVKRSRDWHENIRETSMIDHESIVTAILMAKDPVLVAGLTHAHHSLLQEYYSARLSARDREQIIKVFCRSNPDHFTSIMKDSSDSMEPIIRAVHARVALHKYVPLIQKFVNDLLQTSKGEKNPKTKTRTPPSVEDYVLLLRKHKPSLFKFLHEVSSCCPEIQKLFLDWVKEASTSFRRPPSAEYDLSPSSPSSSRPYKSEKPPRSRSVHSNGSNGHVDSFVGFGGGGGGGAGALSGNLQALYEALPRETQHQVVIVLDLHADYLASLNRASHQNLQQIVDRLAGVRESAVRRSMQGPGVYLARWHALLDSTVITPAAPGRGVPLRLGRDVKGAKTLGKTGMKGAAGESGESESGSDEGVGRIRFRWCLRMGPKAVAAVMVVGRRRRGSRMRGSWLRRWGGRSGSWWPGLVGGKPWCGWLTKGTLESMASLY